MSETPPRRRWEIDSLERIAKLEGVTVGELTERWISEKLADDLRRRLLEKARTEVSNPTTIHQATCAVTMYDMKVQILLDPRGLWVFLKDDSPDRERNIGKINEGALLEWPAALAFHAAMGKALRDRP